MFVCFVCFAIPQKMQKYTFICFFFSYSYSELCSFQFAYVGKEMLDSGFKLQQNSSFLFGRRIQTCKT